MGRDEQNTEIVNGTDVAKETGTILAPFISLPFALLMNKGFIMMAVLKLLGVP